MNWGQHVKKLREEAKITQQDLAQKSGIKRSHLSNIERGIYSSFKPDNLSRLAYGLGKPVNELLDRIYHQEAQEIQETPEQILERLKVATQQLELRRLPILGKVPAGEPFDEKQNISGYIVIPKEELSSSNETLGLFALRVEGNSLTDDGINDGDLVIVDPKRLLCNGKIYIVRCDTGVRACHVYQEDDKVKLVSSKGENEVVEANSIEILGRVILAGIWRQY